MMLRNGALASLLIFALLCPIGETSSARAAAAPVERLYLPNVTKTLGGPEGWTTTIAVQNAWSSRTALRLQLYRFSDGMEAGAFESPVLEPGQHWIFDPLAYATLPEDTQFSAVLDTAGRGAAVAVTSSTVASMSYVAGQLGASRVLLPRVSCQPDGWVTPIIVQNAGDDTAIASITFYGEGGAAAARSELPPLLPGRSAVTLPCGLGLGPGVYSALVEGPRDARLVTVVNEHRTGVARSYLGITDGAERVYLPNVTKFLGGEDGWSTPFVVQNVGDTNATVRFVFRALDSGELVSKAGPVSLAPRQRYAIEVRSLPGLPAGQYSVTIAGDAAAHLLALVDEVENSSGRSTAYPGILAGAPTAYLPFVQKSSGDGAWTSPVIAQNVGTSPADLTLTLFDRAGAVASQRTFISVAPGASVAYDPRADPRLPAGRYAAIMQGSGPVAAVVNHSDRSTEHRAFAYVGAPGGSLPIIASPFRYALETVGGFDFVVVPGSRADLYVQLAAALDPALVANNVDDDIAQLEQEFGHRLARRPQIFLFASADDFHAGRHAVLGDAGAVDPGLGVFVAGTARVGVDWGLGDAVGLAKVRHELTHLVVSEIVGPGADLPAWLNEGVARLEEYGAKGGAFLDVRDRYDTLSMRAAESLFTLDQLTPRAAWFSRIDTPDGRYEYAVAAQAIRFLREDLGGNDGLARLLTLIGQRATLPDAYERLTRRPFDGFARSFPDRVRRLGSVVPGIVSAPGPADEGLAFLLYGFAPSTPLTYSIVFNGIAQTRADFEATTDKRGRLDHFVTPGSLPGTYTMTVVAGDALLRYSAAVPASSSARLSPGARDDVER